MLTKNFHKAISLILMIIILMVFFTTNIFSADYSLSDMEAGLNDLIYDLSLSVVTIEATEPVYPNDYSGIENEAVYNLVSTGVVYDTLGHVLTMAHSVVGKSLIAVNFGDKIIPARIEAVDYQSGVALLQLYKPFGVPVKLSSQSGCAGQILLALGNSYGLRAAPSIGFCAGIRPDGMIQFTAQFSSGARGGGLFSLSGEMVGLIIGSMGESDETGLSIPSNEIKKIVDYLLIHGDRQAGYLGLTTAEIEILPPIEFRPSTQMSMVGMRKYIIDRGVIITDVLPASPAMIAGLRKGDILFGINSLKIKSAFDLANYVLKTPPGGELNFNYVRHSNFYTIKVKAGKKELSLHSFPQMENEFASPQDIVTDKILKEITDLKKAVNSLEYRLKQLK